MKTAMWIVASSVLALSGCATLTRGTTEALVLESKPPGAEARITNGQHCKTPCTLLVKRRAGFGVTFTKEGYETVETNVVPETAGAGAAGMAGNVAFGLGLFIGAAVDASTGATKKLTPNPVIVELAPIKQPEDGSQKAK